MATGYVGLYDDAGSRNAFYRIKSQRSVGFKEFESKAEAEFAHKVQSILADHNLAPRVYGQVGVIRRYDGELTSHGYLTEIARPMPECYDEDCDGECFEGDCENSREIADIVNELDHHGLSYIDHHRGNFGYVRRKRQWIPVVIDVGVESFGDWDADIYGDFDRDSVGRYNDCDCSYCLEERRAARV